MLQAALFCLSCPTARGSWAGSTTGLNPATAGSCAGVLVLEDETGPTATCMSESHPILISEHMNIARGEMWKQLL